MHLSFPSFPLISAFGVCISDAWVVLGRSFINRPSQLRPFLEQDMVGPPF